MLKIVFPDWQIQLVGALLSEVFFGRRKFKLCIALIFKLHEIFYIALCRAAAVVAHAEKHHHSVTRIFGSLHIVGELSVDILLARNAVAFRYSVGQNP